jgi:hypothetical protein
MLIVEAWDYVRDLKTEDGRRRTGIRGLRTEDKMREGGSMVEKADARGQRSDRKSEGGCRISDVEIQRERSAG